MKIDEMKAILAEDWQKIGQYMRGCLKSDIDLLNKLNDFVLSNPGKQLRPLICLLVGRACNEGKATFKTIVFAADAEMLHNATLFHDDVADGSSLRRGCPTVNTIISPSSSVLLGDFWLAKVMMSIMDNDENQKVVKLYEKTLQDLSEGEMLQLQKAMNADTSMDDYLRIIYNKTASLFETLAYSGAYSVGADEELAASMGEYGKKLGLAFQMRDDILDYSRDLDAGKALGVDILEKKITLPMLGAFENAGEAESARIRELIAREADIKPFKEDIFNFVLDNGGLSYAQSVLEQYSREAIKALDILPDSEEKKCLVSLASFVGNRLT